MISVIIPTYNEQNTIAHTITRLISTSSQPFELIIVDGSPNKETLQAIPKVKKEIKIIKKHTHKPGRAVQSNLGANLATGNTLLFLHADTELPEDWNEQIQAHLHTYDAGAFYKIFTPSNWKLKIIQAATNLKARFFRVYGDNALFMKKEVFKEINGFFPLPIFEDVEFVDRLRKHARCKILKQHLHTSSRRFLKGGPIKIIMLMNLVSFLYICGMPPEKIKRIYLSWQ